MRGFQTVLFLLVGRLTGGFRILPHQPRNTRRFTLILRDILNPLTDFRETGLTSQEPPSNIRLCRM